jgi:hypothetical protein
MLAWLSQKGIEISLLTLNQRLAAWQANRRTWTYCTNKDQLAEIVNHLFYYYHTFSDYQIVKRIKEDYQMDTTARQVKEIRLEYGWLRRPARRVVGAQGLTGLGIEAAQEGGEGTVVGLVTSPLWARELSFEHLLEIARTHTDREQASFLPKRVSGFCLPIVAMPSQSYNQPFGIPLSLSQYSG